MIRKYAEIVCWKNVSSFCTAKATHIFSAKNIRILCIESDKTVNEMTLNELVKLTTLWTTGPWFLVRKTSRYTYLQTAVDFLLHGISVPGVSVWALQQNSVHSVSQPQSHSSSPSTIRFPQIAATFSLKYEYSTWFGFKSVTVLDVIP